MSLRLLAWLGLDSSEFNQKLGEASKSAEGFGDKLSNLIKGGPGGLIAAGVGALGLGAAFYEANKMVDELKVRAKAIQLGSVRTGLDPDTFQRFQNVLEAKNSSADEGAVALDHLAQAQEKFRTGSGEEVEKLAQAFAALGISSDGILKSDYRKLFFDIADGIKNTTMNAEKLSAMKELFGRSGANLLPAFESGFTTKLAVADSFSDDELAKIKQLSEVTREATSIWKAFGHEAGMALTKVFTGGTFLLKTVLNPKELWNILRMSGADSSDGAVRYAQEKMQKRMEAISKEKAVTERQQREEKAAADKAAKADKAELEKKSHTNAEKAKRLEEQLKETNRKGQLESQSPAQRVATLNKENAKLSAEFMELHRRSLGGDADGSLDVHKRENILQMSKNDNEIADLLKPKKFSSRENMDGLAKIGGFTGNVDNGLRMLQSQIVQNTKVIAAATTQIAQQTRDN